MGKKEVQVYIREQFAAKPLTLQLSKPIHGHARCPRHKLQQPGPHFIIHVLHSLCRGAELTFSKVPLLLDFH